MIRDKRKTNKTNKSITDETRRNELKFTLALDYGFLIDKEIELIRNALQCV